jgi:adenylate cyclase
MKPERREVAVFYSDVDNFTAIAHAAEPRKVAGVLQEYLTVMTEVVVETHGTVDKYVGDAVMAFWGAPVHLEKPVNIACEAVMQMDAAFAKKKAAWEKKLGHPLLFRIGLDYGETLLGEMGTEHRRIYTGIGEPVATASRLERLAREYGIRVVVTDTVAELAQQKFVFREIDWVQLPTRTKVTRLFELLGRDGEVPSATLERVGKIAAAIGAYHARHFHEARLVLEPLAEADPIARRYAARCAYYERSAPAEDWDGVFDGLETL